MPCYCSLCSSISLVRLVLQDHKTPLHLAVAHAGVVRELCARGANLEAATATVSGMSGGVLPQRLPLLRWHGGRWQDAWQGRGGRASMFDQPNGCHEACRPTHVTLKGQTA